MPGIHYSSALILSYSRRSALSHTLAWARVSVCVTFFLAVGGGAPMKFCRWVSRGADGQVMSAEWPTVEAGVCGTLFNDESNRTCSRMGAE